MIIFSLFIQFVVIIYCCSGVGSDQNTKNAFFLCMKCGRSIAKCGHNIDITSHSNLLTNVVDSIGGHTINSVIVNGAAKLVTFNETNSGSIRRGQSKLTGKTYFPPYSENEIYCSRCDTHVGYVYTAPSITPKSAPPTMQGEASRVVPEESTYLEQLEGQCLTTFHDTWYYHWCFHKRIQQYRLEDEKRTLDWSLGIYTPKINPLYTVRPAGTHDIVPPSPLDKYSGVVYYVESFTGGDYCRETLRGRQAEVWLIAGDKFEISDVTEVTICSYRIIVSVPQFMESEFYTSKYTTCPLCHQLHLVPKDQTFCPYAEDETPPEFDSSTYQTKTSQNSYKFYSLFFNKIIFENDSRIDFIHGFSQNNFLV